MLKKQRSHIRSTNTYRSVDALHNILGGELRSLVLIRGGASLGLAIEERLAVLIEAELGDDDLGGVDADVDGGAIDLLAGDALDVDHPLLAVDLDHLAFAALVGAAYYLDLVVLAYRHRPHAVLGPEVSGERRAHQNAADARRRSEVSLPVLPAGAGDPRIVLHLLSLSLSAMRL